MPHLFYYLDFTVSVFVVYREKVLLADHRQLDRWLPLGGHIEPGRILSKQRCGKSLRRAVLRLSFAVSGRRGSSPARAPVRQDCRPVPEPRTAKSGGHYRLGDAV